MKRSILSVVSVAVLALAFAAPAHAQAQGNIGVSIGIPNVTILYYIQSVTFNLTSANLATALAGGEAVQVTPGVSTLGTTVDAGVDGTPAPSISALAFTITNAWAVRGLGTTTTVAVSITQNPTNTSAVALPLSLTSPASTPVDVSGGMGTAHQGNIQFTADLSAVTSSDTYTGGIIHVSASTV